MNSYKDIFLSFTNFTVSSFQFLRHKHNFMILFSTSILVKVLGIVGIIILLLIMPFILNFILGLSLAASDRWKLPLAFRYFKWLRNKWETIKIIVILLLFTALIILIVWLEDQFIGIF